MTVRAVAFDLDGVLIDSAHNHWLSYNEALAAYGIAIDWARYLRIMGMRREDALRSVARDFDVTIDITEAARVKEERYLRLIESDPRPVAPFVALARRLAARLPVALVTGSYGSTLARVLPGIGLEGVFSTIVSGRDVAMGKPAPDGYALAAKRLGIAAPDCLALEDAPEGVASAKAAGMPCIAICPPGLDATALADADRVLPDRSETSASLVERYVLSCAP
jgi:HAD superfamily hydrolase (TIGR01509 family)